MRWLSLWLAIGTVLLGSWFPLVAQRDVLRDIARALKEPRPTAELLARTPMVVVTNDQTLFNLFRSQLPPVHAAEFVSLTDLATRMDELLTTERSVVVLVDRSRGDVTIEHRFLIPYDLTLIRRQDVVIASEVLQDRKSVRYRVFLSAPSFAGLKQAIERFCQRLVREPRDLRFQEVRPVPVCVVITNAGAEMVNAFAEQVNLNFVWATPETISRVQDLLATETEIYLLLPPVPLSLRERLPFNLNLLAPNQSVAIRKSKGGDYWQVLLYGAFPEALRGLIRRYQDINAVPTDPAVLTHPVIGKVQRLLVVPFGDILYYRDRVGDFAAQVFRAVENERFAAETVMASKPPEPFYDWVPFQEGAVERQHWVAVAKAHKADLVLAGRLLSFDTQTVRRQEISSRPSPAADRQVWEIATVRTETATARLQVWLYEGETGDTIWTKTLTASASKQTVESVRRVEAAQPPPIQPDRVSLFISDERLYASAATAAVAELLTAMREEIHWLAQPTAPVVVAVTPTVIEGLVGGVDVEDGVVFVYVDIGQNQGIRLGDAFRILREIVVRTERKTVRLEEELGEAIVVAVYPEACKARVVYGADAIARWKETPLRARLVPAARLPEPPKVPDQGTQEKPDKAPPALPAPGEGKP